uniref:FHOD1 N-terminal GTPase-binding domain-containing protein n=1 Tax=Oncorhynchus tshawytscha TaxID=74940 RepID=A0AAZ3R594_ONCTS
MATFVCRVQLLDDTDPLNSTSDPEPIRPPIAGVHRLLRLYNSNGCDLRKICGSVLFQDDKDLVHEFVGAEADQNYQHYILGGIASNQIKLLSLHASWS